MAKGKTKKKRNKQKLLAQKTPTPDPGFPREIMGVKIYTQKDWDRTIKSIRGEDRPWGGRGGLGT